MKDYQLDGNKEMVTLGAMNIVGSMTSCYVATGEKKTQTSSWQSIRFLNDDIHVTYARDEAQQHMLKPECFLFNIK